MITIPEPQISQAFIAAERQAMAAYGLEYESHFVDLPKPRMSARVIEVGEGEPVLMVHGALAVAAYWIPLMAQLTDRRILAVDLPGYGLTDPYVYERGRLREVAVSFLDSVIDSLGLDSVPIIANSMGGLWTFWLALDRPSRVERIAQIGCPALILDTSAPASMRILSVRGLNRLLLRMLPTPDGPGELREMGDEPAADVAPPEFLALLEASDKVEAYWPASLSLLEAAVRIRGQRLQLDESELANVEHATVFVWGTSDPFGGLDTAERVASMMREAQLVSVDGGHLAWVGEPQRVADPVRRHLDETMDFSK